MKNNEWIKEFDASIVVCDINGIIVEMNEKACITFSKYGGKKLIGSSLFDCHSEPSRLKLKQLMKEEKTNIYTILKNNIKKIIIQKPWYKEGKHNGLVEISIEIPLEMNHFIRE